MDKRERFLNNMRFKSTDRIPFYPVPIGIWKETMNNWYKQGLSPNVDIYDLFDIDQMLQMGIYFGFSPSFDTVILEEDEETITYINFEGIKMKELKENSELSMPQFIEFPVKTRDDFDNVRYRLQLNEKQRFPNDWKDKCNMWKHRKVPLSMNADREGGFFGPLRNLMGLENLLFSYYDDPGLIEMMIENRVELMIDILGKIFEDTDMDWFVFWEDMAFNHGPLLSPDLFKKYMVPAYRKVTDFLRENGVDIIFVDCDGKIDKLIPLWIEAGVNGIYPFEVQSGMDVVKLRMEYKNDLLMIGGIDKRVLTRGKKEIDDEIRRVSSIFDHGGYIPGLDHSVPPNVPLENFIYYIKSLSKIIGV